MAEILCGSLPSPDDTHCLSLSVGFHLSDEGIGAAEHDAPAEGKLLAVDSSHSLRIIG
jgi:hypothetical protein